MGVYIKSMKMPENCLECEIRSYDANAGEEYCPFSQIVCLSIGIQDNCPLVEVPDPHGRLIDADAVSLEGGPYEYDEWCKWALTQYQDAPTIIEAEE